MVTHIPQKGMILLWASLVCSILAFISVEHLAQAHHISKDVHLWAERLTKYQAALESCRSGVEEVGRAPTSLHWPVEEVTYYTSMRCDKPFDWMRQPIEKKTHYWAKQTTTTSPIVQFNPHAPTMHVTLTEEHKRFVLTHTLAFSDKVLHTQEWPYGHVLHWRMLDLKGTGYVDTALAFLQDQSMIWMSWVDNKWLYRQLSLPIHITSAPTVMLAPQIPKLRLSTSDERLLEHLDCDWVSGCHLI